MVLAVLVVLRSHRNLSEVLLVLVDWLGNKRSVHLLILQSLPVEPAVPEPCMVLDLGDAIPPESVVGLSLDHLNYVVCYPIDKIDGTERPPIGQIIFRQLYLLSQNIISNFPAVPAVVGSPAHHHLIGDNSHGVVVHRVAVVLPAHHLGSHVARRARSIGTVARLEVPSHTQIGDSQIALIVHD